MPARHSECSSAPLVLLTMKPGAEPGTDRYSASGTICLRADCLMVNMAKLWGHMLTTRDTVVDHCSTAAVPLAKGHCT